MIIPMVVESDGRNERAYDIFSSLMKERIIFIGSEIDDRTSNLVVAQLLHLEAMDPDAPISIYISSPGGSVYHGLAITDCMNFISCPVKCIAFGLVASMGAVIFACGDKGERIVLPDSRIMIHQVSGGFQGQASDIRIHAEEAQYLNNRLHTILAEKTGQSVEKIKRDAQRDFFLSAKDAVEYGIADRVVSAREVKKRR